MEGIQHRIVKVNGIKMHVAEKGEGPLILFLHGFPELWYSWRHQMLAMASLGYRALAPDLRGYGDTDAPLSVESYSCFHVVGDLVALLDAVAAREKVFVVGHDWGAAIAWYLCLLRRDRVKAVLNLSVPYIPANRARKPVEVWRALFGDDYYICRFQEPGEIESEFADAGTDYVVRRVLTYRRPDPLYLPKGKLLGDDPVVLPSWLSEEDIKYYVSKFEKNGFAGPVNYYRNFDRNWELSAPWAGSQVQVPAKFVVGDKDLVYHVPGIKDYIHKGGLKKDVPLLEDAVVIPGAGHFINQERPDDINQHIYAFFQQFSSKSSL